MFRGAFPAITNRQSFIDEVELLDADDGTRIDLTGCTIHVEIRDADCTPRYGDYSTAFSYLSASRLLATTADGSIIIPDIGVFVFTFTTSQVASLCPGLYAIGCNIARDGAAAQLWLGLIPVLDGVVPR